MFPFGHGGSYTEFAWGEPSLAMHGDDVVVEVPVRAFARWDVLVRRLRPRGRGVGGRRALPAAARDRVSW
jgi:hypothetical protein